ILKQQVIELKKPFLGICLGMQLLARQGTEGGQNSGLGWVNATVSELKPGNPSLKLPHFGWNDVLIRIKHPLFNRLGERPIFYFAHSYVMHCRIDKQAVAITDYGVKFVSAVLRDNVFATQFHPEKSQRNGIRLLENFVDWDPNKC
ncbi:imidazole glycerol phosphate synthase subunit HisH, partial [Candidatus Babeliales bacterium]|nr:imidazole glycerol phosphate synthase subunit HisH [Candidatus Babeliales bacterium]